MRFDRLKQARVSIGFATLFCFTLLHAADPLPDRRAVRAGAAPVVGIGGDSTSRAAMLELVTQLETLQTEVRQLRGQLEVQTHELERLKTQQRDALADFDQRLQQLERKGTPSPSAFSEPDGAIEGSAPIGTSRTTQGVLPASTPTTMSPQGQPSSPEQQEYDTAFALMKQGQYERAGKSFKEFTVRHPRSPLADNAQYWAAEAAYVTRNFRQAQEEFSKVLSIYPNSPKVPDALLKIGYSYYELGAIEQARTALNQVMSRFPNTTVAKAAEARLAKMTKEKR